MFSSINKKIDYTMISQDFLNNNNNESWLIIMVTTVHYLKLSGMKYFFVVTH